MINSIFKGFFYVFSKIIAFLVSPLVGIIDLAFDFDILGYINYFAQFLSTSFQYVHFFRDLLCIPVSALLLYFNYIIIKYVLYLGIRIYNFTMNVWYKLKP